jgi:flagellar motor switch protein FliM
VSGSVRTSRQRTVSSSAQDRRRRPRGAVTAYDFRRPVKLSRENSRALQIVFETFARQASTVMTAALRLVCHVGLVEIEQQNYHEYVDSLDDLTHMTVFSVEPIQQSAVLQMPVAVTMAFVDRMLGGPAAGEQPERPLTDLESAVVRALYERLVAEVRYAFAALAPLEPRVTGVEYSPHLAQIADSSDAMVVARFQVTRGALTHPITLCMSFNGLLPFLNASGTMVTDRERSQRQEAAARLETSLQDVPVDVAVRFRSATGDPFELSALRVGDVIRLDHPQHAPLDVTAADVLFAHATPGSQGQRLAALVVAPPLQERP